jgi:hypothetical protein
MIGDQPNAQVKIMSHRISLLLAAAASFLLSGCFFSETPKFVPETGVAIFGEGGRYQGYERLDGDQYKKDEAFVVKRRTDSGYDLIDEKGETQRITFHAIAGGYHVGQVRSDKELAYAYVVVRVSGNESYVYIPRCDTQDKALLLRHTVTLNRQFECTIDKVFTPVEFFEALKLDQPTSKLVRE